MTLSHTTELVWVWQKGYLWSRHCDRGKREGEENPSKHPSRPVSSEELHWQEMQSLGIQSGWSRIPSSFPNERCTPLQYQRKLAPRYIGPYPIIDKYGPTYYQVELPAKLSEVHNVFYVSQLKRCLKPLTDVVIEDTIPLEPDLTYKAYPIKILDQQDWVTRNKTTRFNKI
jgi:hypothetical protein